MLDVLMYLFQNYLHPESPPDAHLPPQDALIGELTEAGFSLHEVTSAFHWLAGIPQLQESVDLCKAPLQAVRCYLPQEMSKLSQESRGFLLALEQAGILNDTTRESVIERAMALDVEYLELEGIKWVVLMVLLNQVNREEAMEWLDHAAATMSDENRVIH